MEWIDQADGVFRGGGVKGLGLAGALVGFAEHPTQPIKTWVNVAGASAGAIIACYLATGHDANQMVELMKKTKFGDFQDFPGGRKIFGGIPNLVVKHGLARGEKFRTWFNEVLEGATFAKVKVKKDDGTTEWRLKLIACDITNRSLLALPHDLPLYRKLGGDGPIDPDEFRIADAARMSMSIPYFFEPVQLVRDRVMVTSVGDADGLAANQPADRTDVLDANGDVQERGGKEAAWRELTDAELKAQRSVIVDGGTLSNFPVWLFDARAGEKLTRPTFGFTLTGGKGIGGGVNQALRYAPWAVRFGFDIFHTAQEAWDRRFVSHSTVVRTVAVDAGTIGTTQFDLTVAQQNWLIDSGKNA